jgi:hypothetical protein
VAVEFFPDEDALIERDAMRNPLTLDNYETPAFAGFGSELYRAPMRAFAGLGAAGTLAAAGALRMHGITAADDTLFSTVDRFRAARDYWSAEPGEVGVAGRVVGGLTEFGTLLGLGLGNPALAIGATELNTAADLATQGVDPMTAVGAGVAEAATTAAAFQVPFFGKTLAQRILFGAGANVAGGAGVSLAVQQVLERRGYAQQAEAYDPWNLEARAVDVLAGALFGGVSHRLDARRAQDTPPPQADAPPADVPPADATLTPDPEVLDAVAALNAHRHRVVDLAPGRPRTPEALDAHVAAIRQAVGELAADQPVTASVRADDFETLPPSPEVEAARQAMTEELKPAPRVPAARETMPVDGQLGARLTEIDQLPPEGATIAPALRQMFEAAARAKPQFDSIVQDIVREVGGATAMLADLKGTKRAFDKVRDDYAGDASQIKDLVRGTIEVRTLEQAQAVIERLGQRFAILPKGQRNLLRADVEPVDGYRDAKFNVMIDGHVAEIQVNVPAMMAAKKDAHAAYEARSKIERASAKRERTPAEQAEIDRLNAEMKAVYDSAWAEATSARNSSQETGAPLRRADPGSNARGSDLSQAVDENGDPGTLPSDTGMPSTSKTSTLGGADAGKSMDGTSNGRIVARTPQGLEEAAAAEILRRSPDLQITDDDGNVISAADALAAADAELAAAETLAPGAEALASCAIRFIGD